MRKCRELKRNCTNCVHGRWDYTAEDYVCQNPNSQWFAQWVAYDMRCMQWKGESNDSSGHGTGCL